MTASQEPKLPNRQSPFSEPFRSFICVDWQDYPDQLPHALAGATAASHHRQALSQHFPKHRLIIPAGGLKVRNNDCDYRFRPHTAFTWLTGLGTDREPDAVLVMEPVDDDTATDAHHRSTLYFHPRVPRTDPEFYADSRYGEMWVGQRESLEEMSALGRIICADISTLDQALSTLSETIPTAIVRDADPNLTSRLDDLYPPQKRDDIDLETTLSELRLIKDDYELDQMRQACEATAVGFEAVVKELPNAIANGRGERWVEGIFGLHARHRGNAVGYDTIAASGDHANTLHWIRNDGDLNPSDLLLMDAGVELDSLFTADITRTMPISGRFSPEQRMVYEAVLAAQQAGIDAARPGARFSDVHQAAIEVIVDYLDSWGILPVSKEEALDPERGGHYRRWMVHGTSHHLGLDVHDCAQARRECYRDGILKAGMVITVEPGIYFKSTDLTVPERLRGIGVRIEDDIAITDAGCEILSHHLPRDPDELEAWMDSLLHS